MLSGHIFYIFFRRGGIFFYDFCLPDGDIWFDGFKNAVFSHLEISLDHGLCVFDPIGWFLLVLFLFDIKFILST